MLYNFTFINILSVGCSLLLAQDGGSSFLQKQWQQLPDYMV